MPILVAARGDLALIDDEGQGLNGLYLVDSADIIGQSMEVYPIDQPAALREAKDAVVLADWPKAVAFRNVLALYSCSAIGF